MKKLMVIASVLLTLVACGKTNTPEDRISHVTYATVEDLDNDRELILTSDQYFPIIEMINESDFKLTKEELVDENISIKLQEMFIIYYKDEEGNPISQNMLFITEDDYVGLIIAADINSILFADETESSEILKLIRDAIK